MIEIYPVKIKKITLGDNFTEILIEKTRNILRDDDIIVVSSKPILISSNKVVNVNRIRKISRTSMEYASKCCLDPRFVELVFQHADYVFGCTKGFLLASINDILLPNAGIDRKNVPGELYAVPDFDFRGFARNLYFKVKREVGVKVGVIVIDSTVAPLRRGTRGVALAVYGFKPIKSYVGEKDLFDKEIMVTTLSIADCIASAALLAIGEGRESVPAAVVRGVNVEFIEEDLSDELLIDINDCLYSEALMKSKYSPK